MCGKGWVVKGYSALSEDSAVLGGLCGERGLLSFCKGCRNGEGRCNGRSEQGKEALSVCAQGLARTQSQLSTHRRSPYEKRGG